MAEARERIQWAHTSSLMALIVNLLRNPKREKAVKPADFNPYMQGKQPIVRVNMKELKKMLGNRALEVVTHGGGER